MVRRGFVETIARKLRMFLRERAIIRNIGSNKSNVSIPASARKEDNM